MYKGEHEAFLFRVQEYVSEHPDVAPMVTDFIRRGIQQALQETQQRACDMETCLVWALNPRMNGAMAGIVEKLLKWKNKSAMRWDSELERLNKKLEPKSP